MIAIIPFILLGLGVLLLSIVGVCAMVVIGDSLSAGDFADKEIAWPKLLSAEHEIPVINLAQNGAT